MRRLPLSLLSAIALLAVAAPAASADEGAGGPTLTATSGSSGEIQADHFAFGGYFGGNGAGSEGLETTMVVPDYDCQPDIDGYYMVSGIFTYSSSWPIGDVLTGGGGVSVACTSQGELTYTAVLIDSADVRVVDKPVQAGDKLEIAFVTDGPNVAHSTLVNKTQGWEARTVPYGIIPVKTAYVGIRNDIKLDGQQGSVLTPERTKFSKIVLNGERVKKTTMEPFTMDYGLGDPYLVPTKMKKSGFKLDKWHPEG